MSDELKKAEERLTATCLVMEGTSQLYTDIRLVLDALEEAQWVKTDQLIKSLEDERWRVGAEELAGLDNMHLLYGQCVLRSDVERMIVSICGMEGENG